MKKKILLALLIVTILTGIGGAYAYFATDMFKSNKKLFFSYLSSEIADNLKSEKISKYLEKKQNTSYTNKGDISINIEDESDFAEDETIELLNSSSISLEGKTDNAKAIAEQTITINLEQDINVPIKIKRDEETLGIQSNLLYNKFIAIRNQDLKTLFERMGADAEGIPDKIDFEKVQFNQEETKSLKDKYTKILYENLEDDLFSKEKMDGQTIITLKLSEKKCSEIIIKLLETLRDDEIVINKFSEVIDEEEFKQNINDKIEEISDVYTDENNEMHIKIYGKSKEAKKMEIIIQDEDTNELAGRLEITKNEDEEDLTYIIKVELDTESGEKAIIEFNVSYKNMGRLNDIEEDYEIKITITDTESENINIVLNYNNLITFTEGIEFESFNNDNSTILNDITDEELEDMLLEIYRNLGLY